MSHRLDIGVVGCGYWGPNLIRNFRALPECRLKMVCDVSEPRLRHLRSLYPEVEGETRYEHMLNGANLDAIVIATSVKHHFPMAKASLLAGKHTLIEKPLARSTAECEELVELAGKLGLVLMVGHTLLYSPAVRRIQAIVDSGEIGEIRHICARRLNLGRVQNDINAAWDLAPHDLSLILHLLREPPLSVNCVGAAHATPGIEEVTAMSLFFSGGRSAFIQSSWLEPRKIREMTIVGSRRTIVYDDVAPREKLTLFDAREADPAGGDPFGEAPAAFRSGEGVVPDIGQEEPLRAECRHFLDCIQHHITPLTGGPQGLEVVRILTAASRSLALQGAPVSLPL